MESVNLCMCGEDAKTHAGGVWGVGAFKASSRQTDIEGGESQEEEEKVKKES